MKLTHTKQAGFALAVTALATPFLLGAQEAASPHERPVLVSQVLPRTMPDVAEAPRLTTAESKIDVVFVLDTTGSMSGLIEAAKQKVWSIANAIALAEPRPEIRMGLVGYRDRGDDYVTRLTPLTADLDLVFTNLMAFTAGGGGDGPESVNQALHEAVTAMEWDRDPNALRLVYLVGDAEPHMDYDDVKYVDSCTAAATAGIFVNTIQCGRDARTAEVWQEISRRAEGRFFSIDASGGVVAIATPFDAEMARLGGELEGTLVHYGSKAEQDAAGARSDAFDAAAASAPAEALAERAAFASGEAGRRTLTAGKDLIDHVLSGVVQLDEVDEAELPAELQAMEPALRVQFVEQKAKERQAVRAKIQALQAEREHFIKDELSKRGDAADGFDDSVLDALKEQAAKKGIQYEGKERPVESAETPR